MMGGAFQMLKQNELSWVELLSIKISFPINNSSFG